MVFWDGESRLEIYAGPSFVGKTLGLCGIFDGNTETDFTTRAGIVEANVNLFGNSWKARESCSDLPATTSTHPCDIYAQRKSSAVNECTLLKDANGIFSGINLQSMIFKAPWSSVSGNVRPEIMPGVKVLLICMSN